MPIIYHYLRDFPCDDRPLNGGMEKAVGGLAGGLVACGVESVVLCEAFAAKDFVRTDGGYRVRCFDHTATEHKRFGMPDGLRDFVHGELAQSRDRLVILNAIFHPTVHLLSKMFRKLGIPYIAAPHDPYHPAIFEGSRAKKLLWWQFIEKPMLRHARAVQVLDARHGKYLRDRGVKTEAIEVVNGFAPIDVPDESTLSWRQSGPVRILFLGRLDRINKGLDLLIDAFAQLATNDPQLHLTLHGPDRGDGAALREQVDRLLLSERISILGPDFATRPGDLAAQFDLFVLPSRFEGFGLSAMEAMLGGRPVAISDIAGLSPHVRRAEAGVVIQSTVESIRDGIAQLLSRRNEWESIGMRGRRYVLENLNWKQIAAGALPHYQRITVR